ncbi:MAG: hypothetical protein AMXMBFR57_38860 [Acidimicrobiia bacterium]
MRIVFILAGVILGSTGNPSQSAPPALSGTWVLDTSGANTVVWPLCGMTCQFEVESAGITIRRDQQAVVYPTDGSRASETINGPYGQTTLTRSGSWKDGTLTLRTGGATTTLTAQGDTLTIVNTLAGSGRGSTTTARYRRK